jgi:hypothetical protein
MIYFIQADGVGHIKIGFTDGDDAEIRLATLQTGSPVPLRLIGTRPGGLEEEKDFHRRFASARAHGEWFQPVPELLAVIAPAESLTCGQVEVVTRSVQIRALTVGRKQFTKSLFGQLPTGSPIYWKQIWEQVERLEKEGVHEDQIIGRFSALDYLDGDVWGFVRGGTEEHPGLEFRSYKWIVFARYGVLTKHQDYASLSGRHHLGHLCEPIYRTRFLIPNWTDQLFIGV